jgi:hypothetical protein
MGPIDADAALGQRGRVTHAAIPRIPIDSSSIASLGYSPQDHLLEVEFHRGAVYRFFLVPEVVYRDFLCAESKGRYFNQSIRDRFPFETTG